MKSFFFLTLVVCSVAMAIPQFQDVIFADQVQILRSNATLSKYPEEQPSPLADGQMVAKPFLFESNSMLALEVFVDFEKAKELLSKEGLKPIEFSRGGVRKAKLTINVAQYPRTTTGSFADMRMWFDVQVKSTDSRSGLYSPGIVWWRYYTDVETNERFEQVRDASVRAAGLSREEIQLTAEFSTANKSASAVLMDGSKLFNLSFDGTRLQNNPFLFLDQPVLTIVPQNKEFSPIGTREEAHIAVVNGLFYPPVPFDKTRDTFQLYGKIAQDFAKAGFNLDDAQWAYSPYYVGMFQSDPTEDYK